MSVLGLGCVETLVQLQLVFFVTGPAGKLGIGWIDCQNLFYGWEWAF